QHAQSILSGQSQLLQRINTVWDQRYFYSGKTSSMVLSSIWRSVFDALDDIADELLPLLSPASGTDDASIATERDELSSPHGDETGPEGASIGLDEDTLDHVIVNWEGRSTPGDDKLPEPYAGNLENESDDREESDVCAVSDGLMIEHTGSALSFGSKESTVTVLAVMAPDVLVEDVMTNTANQDRSDPAWNIDEPVADLECIKGRVGKDTRLVKSPPHTLGDSHHAAGHGTPMASKHDPLEEGPAGKPPNNSGSPAEANDSSDDCFRSSDDWDFTTRDHLRPEAITIDMQNCDRPARSAAGPDKSRANGDDLDIGIAPWSSHSDLLPGQTQNALEGVHDNPRLAEPLMDTKGNVRSPGVEQNGAEAGNESLPLSGHGNAYSAEHTRQSERSKGEPTMILNDVVANSARSLSTPSMPLADTSELDVELLSPRSTTSRHSSASFGSSLSRKSDKWSSTEPSQPVVSISTDNASASAPSSGSQPRSAHDALRMGVPRSGVRARYRSVLSRRAKSPAKKLKLRGNDAEWKRDGKAREVSGMWNTSYGPVDHAMLIPALTMSRLKAVLDNALGQANTDQEKQHTSEEAHEKLDEKTPPPPSPKPNDYYFNRTPTQTSQRTNEQPKQVPQHLSHVLDSGELIKKLHAEANKIDQTLSVPPLQRSESSRSRRRRARAEDMSINVAAANDVDSEPMSDNPQINHYAALVGAVPYENALSAVLGSAGVGEAAEMGVGPWDGGERVWRVERWVQKRVRWTRRRSAVERVAGGTEGAWVERGGAPAANLTSQHLPIAPSHIIHHGSFIPPPHLPLPIPNMANQPNGPPLNNGPGPGAYPNGVMNGAQQQQQGQIIPAAGHYADMQNLMEHMEALGKYLEKNREEWRAVEEGLGRVERQHMSQGGAVNGNVDPTPTRAELLKALADRDAEIRTLRTAHLTHEKLATLYEETLSDATERIRTYVYEQQAHVLELHRHYTALLAQSREETIEAQLVHQGWQAALGRLSEEVRAAWAEREKERRGWMGRWRGVRGENRVLRRMVGWEVEGASEDEDEGEEGSGAG
ncbi:SGF29 tudor-like domain, partial [Teratosphaeria destructans]